MREKLRNRGINKITSRKRRHFLVFGIFWKKWEFY